MKNFLLVATILLFPVLVFAQVDAGVVTSTAGVDTGAGVPPTDVEDVVGVIPAIWNAFTSAGLLAGLAAIFGSLAVIMNFGPLKRRLAASSFDWLRPLVMLISVGGGAGVGAFMMTPNVIGAVIAGLTAGLGSGYVQKLIQEVND